MWIYSDRDFPDGTAFAAILVAGASKSGKAFVTWAAPPERSSDSKSSVSYPLIIRIFQTAYRIRYRIGQVVAWIVLSLQICSDFGELSKGGLEVFDDLGGDDIGWREVGAVFERFVFEP
jgi:hypothetical protein